MRFVKIFLIIIFILLAYSMWIEFQYRIYYFFGDPPKEEILFLQKKVKENNRTAVIRLLTFYREQRNTKMYIKYFKIKKRLDEGYCKVHKYECYPQSYYKDGERKW